MSNVVSRKIQWMSIIAGTFALATSWGMAQTPQLEVCRREGPPGCSIEADPPVRITPSCFVDAVPDLPCPNPN